MRNKQKSRRSKRKTLWEVMKTIKAIQEMTGEKTLNASTSSRKRFGNAALTSEK